MAWRIFFFMCSLKGRHAGNRHDFVIRRTWYTLSKYFMNSLSGFNKRRLKGIKQYEKKDTASEAPAGQFAR